MEDFLKGETLDYLTDPSSQEPVLEWVARVPDEKVVVGEAVCNGTIDTKHERRRRRMKEEFKLDFEN